MSRSTDTAAQIHILIQLNIGDLDIKAYFFVEIMIDYGKHGQRTQPKWALINRPEMPQNFSTQSQKFGISMKKGFIVRPGYFFSSTFENYFVVCTDQTKLCTEAKLLKKFYMSKFDLFPIE